VIRQSGILGISYHPFEMAGTLNYEMEDVEPKIVRDTIFDRACDVMEVMADSLTETTKPWALKEPLLRFMLPAFDRVIGEGNYKLLHVVRDVRHIHDNHHDWKRAGVFMTPKHTDGVGGLKHALEEAFDKSGPIQRGFPKEKRSDIERWVEFAYVWAHVELELHEIWTTRRPSRYMLIRDLDLGVLDSPTGKGRALGSFLGNTDPSMQTLFSIGKMYDAKQASPMDSHFELMDAIIRLPSMRLVRRAMKVFGYL